MKRQALASICFFLVVIIVFFFIQWAFVLPDSSRIGMYRKEKPDTLDAVFIGGSNVHYFWVPLIGWHQYGIAVWDYSVGECSIAALKYMLIEARKTHPDALYLINLNTFKTNTANTSIAVAHRHLDSLPLSVNKIQLINTLADYSGYTYRWKRELLFPIIRFHTRWDRLSESTFGIQSANTKSSITGLEFLNKTYRRFPEQFEIYPASTALSDDVSLVLKDLLDYCDQNHVNVLFIKVPQATSSQDRQGRMNEVERLVIKRGYPCIDLLENVDDLGLDLRTDYMSAGHMNVHGAIKFCRYLGNYLKENYGFTDKRGTAGWESWDRAEKDYMDYLSPYLFPFEADGKRTDLPEPVFVVHQSSVPGDRVKITWDPIAGADGYAVYRKTEGQPWELAMETEQPEYDEANTDHTYTVVPYQILDGEKYYGHFDVKGISLT